MSINNLTTFAVGYLQLKKNPEGYSLTNKITAKKMEYNTQRKKMIIPEYGRNVQKMIDYAVGIEDREERTKTAKFIVSVMANMHPAIRETNDYEHKLWDHMFIMSDFKLDVDAPFPKPEPKTVNSRPDKIPYSEDKIKYKHYGKNLEKIIDAAKNMEEGEEKEILTLFIANQMKKLYLTWNRDTVDDELILKQLEILSEGKLTLDKETVLIDSGQLVPQKSRNKKKKKASNGRKRNYSQRY